MKGLQGGWKIKQLFHELLSDYDQPNFKATKCYSNEDISEAIHIH